MSWGPMAALVRRDLTVVLRSRAVSLPILVVPIVVFGLLPAGLVLIASGIGQDFGEFQEVLEMMPAAIRNDLAGLEPTPLVLVWGLEYAFASLFLLVPLMTSAVIAADSFAGERERKTIEALTYTPLSDAGLYAAKLAGPWLAAVAIGMSGYLLLVVVSNVLAAGIVGRPLLITSRWLLVVVWLTPAIATVAIGALVLVSARVQGFQEAYQLGGLLVLPVVALLVGQVTGVLYLDALATFALGVALWLVGVGVVMLGYRSFRRERLLGA